MSLEWDGSHLKIIRCAVGLSGVGEESDVTPFLSSGNTTCGSLTWSVLGLLGGKLPKYGEAFKFYGSLYFQSVAKCINE